mmetsp:Transcript_45887/g.109281  ORF Transcript_45887/g.109281 Transcript_45887/m.109281 type:complete len:330 (-) Transcript_45887:186-1175(-)|eukprot:CAMPEP_0178424678 /NCGR_PEP_ID=MMETSP0689_2-20121128/28334_1 /TAXON_ID=160604 /ORGANISM="Amphidinium massartii, Strain CS-259" /LENGTH=329 /DNA_ID=CAMNT_0020046323 /DNA_START=138 /DNA_END=1127 /DNA_ORIENTATION=+
MVQASAATGLELRGNNLTAALLEEFIDFVARPSDAALVSGLPYFLASLCAWTFAWIVLFYILSYTTTTWMAGVPDSSKDHENDRYWCARTVLGILHAIVVSVLAIPCGIMLLGADAYAQFGYSYDIALCEPDPHDARLAAWRWEGMLVAYAGLIFTSFILADVVVSALHKLASWDYMLHHIIFATAAILIRGHCILPLNAAILLAMELSTPCLNYVMLLRHRPLSNEWLSSTLFPTGICFMVLFVAIRLVLGVYGVILLWENRWRLLIPTWQVYFLLAAVTAGLALQLFWFPAIFATFWTKLRQSVGGAEEEEKPRTPEADLAAGYVKP